MLKNQLARRRELNPRYSLRSFAAKLEISPSKLSEIISGKKKLSGERAEKIVQKLGLAPREAEVFVLSAKLGGERKGDSEGLAERIQQLAREIQASQSEQRNAWYFGAVKALAQRKLEASSIQKILDIAPLQVENALRFINRLKKFHPEKEDITFESSSLVKKIQDGAADESLNLDADFIFLDSEQAEELVGKIKNLVKSYKIKGTPDEKLKMFIWGYQKL